MLNKQKIFIEYGFDLDNNRFGFGRSVEIENPDGTEYRTKEKGQKLVNKCYYFRLWIGKYLIVISRANGFEFIRRKRNNFKVVLGMKEKPESSYKS